jgi:hypothetical protein
MCSITGELWEATAQEPIILQIRTRNWRSFGHTLRKGDESIEKQALGGISREPEGERDRGKPGEGPLWTKQKNAATHGARLRGWRVTQSHGDASHTPHVPNGMKAYIIAAAATATTTTTITTTTTTDILHL